MKVTIGVPIAKLVYIEKTIKCLLNQTFKDLEIVLVDDSPEGIPEKIINHKQVRYYRNESKLNIIDNWNKVLSLTNGEYFVLFSDDDLCDTQYIEKMVFLADKYPKINCFRSRINIIDENDRIVNIAQSSAEYETTFDFLWNRIAHNRIHYMPDFMFKTDKLKAIGGFVKFPAAWCTDETTALLASFSEGIVTTNELLVSWRRSSSNVSHIGYIEEKMDAVYQWYQFTKSFIDKNSSLYNIDRGLFIKALDRQLIRRIRSNYLCLARAKGLLNSFIAWRKYAKKYKTNFRTYISFLPFYFNKNE